MCLEFQTPVVVKLRSKWVREVNLVGLSMPTKINIKYGNVDQWQTNVRRSAPEEGTGGSQNNSVSIRSTIITDKSNIL